MIYWVLKKVILYLLIYVNLSRKNIKSDYHSLCSEKEYLPSFNCNKRYIMSDFPKLYREILTYSKKTADSEIRKKVNYRYML